MCRTGQAEMAIKEAQVANEPSVEGDMEQLQKELKILKRERAEETEEHKNAMYEQQQLLEAEKLKQAGIVQENTALKQQIQQKDREVQDITQQLMRRKKQCCVVQ